MKEIDARGKACPIPVVLTKQQIDAGEAMIVTRVDNTAAVENLMRLGESQGYSTTLREAEGCYEVTLSETGKARTAREDKLDAPAAPSPAQPAQSGGLVVFAPGEHFGEGDAALGATLMNMLFFTLAENGDTPAAVLFLNSGVKLPTENEEIIGHLKRLEERGCAILSCGACLKYYGLADKLAVGRVSNMYEILERMRSADKVLRL